MTEPGCMFLAKLNSTIEKKLTKACLPKQKVSDNPGPCVQESSLRNYAQFTCDSQIVSLNIQKPVYSLLANSDLRLKLFDKEYAFDLNPPSVDSIEISKLIMVGYPVSPSLLKISNGCPKTSHYDWYVSEPINEKETSRHLKRVPNNLRKWKHRSTGYYFKPTKADIGRLVKLVCTPKDDSLQRVGCSQSAFSAKPIVPEPEMLPIKKRHQYTKDKAGPDEIRIVTYNILADIYTSSAYAKKELYPQCPAFALDIEYR